MGNILFSPSSSIKKFHNENALKLYSGYTHNKDEIKFMIVNTDFGQKHSLAKFLIVLYKVINDRKSINHQSCVDHITSRTSNLICLKKSHEIVEDIIKDEEFIYDDKYYALLAIDYKNYVFINDEDYDILVYGNGKDFEQLSLDRIMYADNKEEINFKYLKNKESEILDQIPALKVGYNNYRKYISFC